MANTLKRTNLMPSVSIDGALEKDIIQSNWDLFKINRPIGFDNIQRIDIQRPDLFSLRVYNSIDYWWILSKVNTIDDWYNDVYVGMDVIIPDIQDITDFTINVRARQREA